MTTERRRAIITISITLIIGILAGALGSGLWGRNHYRHKGDRGNNEKRMDFESKILKIVDADEVQKKVLKPIINMTTTRIDSLQSKTDREVRIVMDSLDMQFKSVLKEEQYAKFKEFSNKIGGHKKHR
jgi:hypothetical protein